MLEYLSNCNPHTSVRSNIVTQTASTQCDYECPKGYFWGGIKDWCQIPLSMGVQQMYIYIYMYTYMTAYVYIYIYHVTSMCNMLRGEWLSGTWELHSGSRA